MAATHFLIKYHSEYEIYQIILCLPELYYKFHSNAFPLT
jgi:hypothetical protein